MRRAFVSHSTADDSVVAEMESFLRASGFDEVFNDVHAIKPDEQFWPRIEQGITDCDAFVVVITAAATNSEWVKREVELARRLGKRVIPVWREDCPLPTDFSDRDVIDFRPRPRKERRFDIGRIVKYAPAELIGREVETELVTDAWQKTLRMEKGRPHVLTFVALGGEGKTSLVAKWVAELAGQDWPGCDAAFAWSFYSQGTREQMAASSDLFLKEALTFFGDEAMAGSAAGAFEKGRRLAQLVSERRALLILDGLEPLQYAPTAPTPGELKDQGIAALLKGLAAASHGLCVVTTRYSLPDLKAFWQTTETEVKLLRLSCDAGVHLLKTLGVRGTAQEFATLVEDVKGHALTLTLLGGFLKRAFHGDIRQRDRVKFEKADEKMDGGHAFRTMGAYEQWLLRDGGDEGRREVAVLRLIGLFDRPADAGCLHALLQPPVVPGLTEPLVGLAEDDWNFCLSGLETAKLLTMNRDAVGALVSLDAHPLLREYFTRQLHGQQPDAWREAHRRLYKHLCAGTPDKPETLEGLQPLFHAVYHGILAGQEQEALDQVFQERILRNRTNLCEYFASGRLGAASLCLETVKLLFTEVWTQVTENLHEMSRATVLHNAGFWLRNLGRFQDAVKPLRRSFEMAKTHWEKTLDATIAETAAHRARNLGQLYLWWGNLGKCEEYSKLSVEWANRSPERSEERTQSRCKYASYLTVCGQPEAAARLYCESEEVYKSDHPGSQTLPGFRGFLFSEFLINARDNDLKKVGGRLHKEEKAEEVFELLAFGLLLMKKVEKGLSVSPERVDSVLAKVIERIRVTEGIQDVARAVLARARWRRIQLETGSLPGGHSSRDWIMRSARTDLDDAWEISERGPMRLRMADIHLCRARLFFREKQYPWESPAADLAAAEKLIHECGYHRRDEELADAKRAILGT